MIPNEVFHYTKADNGLKILLEKKLRWSQFKDVNDPRESKERIFLNLPASLMLDRVE